MKNNNDIVKQISISFESKSWEQEIAKFIKKQKYSLGVSEYIKRLVIEDMKKEENVAKV